MARIIIDVPDNLNGDDLQVVLCSALTEYQENRGPSPEIYVRERNWDKKLTSSQLSDKVARAKRYRDIARAVHDAIARDHFLVEE